jgi:hypothetical protein
MIWHDKASESGMALVVPLYHACRTVKGNGTLDVPLQSGHHLTVMMSSMEQDLELTQQMLHRLTSPNTGTAARLAATRRLAMTCAQALRSQHSPFAAALLRMASVFAASAIAALQPCPAPSGAVSELGSYVRLLRRLRSRLHPGHRPQDRRPDPPPPRHQVASETEQDAEALVASSGARGAMGTTVAHLQAMAQRKGMSREHGPGLPALQVLPSPSQALHQYVAGHII